MQTEPISTLTVSMLQVSDQMRVCCINEHGQEIKVRLDEFVRLVEERISQNLRLRGISLPGDRL